MQQELMSHPAVCKSGIALLPVIFHVGLTPMDSTPDGGKWDMKYSHCVRKSWLWLNKSSSNQDTCAILFGIVHFIAAFINLFFNCILPEINEYKNKFVFTMLVSTHKDTNCVCGHCYSVPRWPTKVFQKVHGKHIACQYGTRILHSFLY